MSAKSSLRWQPRGVAKAWHPTYGRAFVFNQILAVAMPSSSIIRVILMPQPRTPIELNQIVDHSHGVGSAANREPHPAAGAESWMGCVA